MRVILGLCVAALLALISAPAQAQRSNLGGPCTTELQGEGWTAAEVWAWNQICVGNIANMMDFVGEDGTCNPKNIPAAQAQKSTISAQFIRLIATNSRYVNTMARPLIGLNCARIDGFLDLDNMDISPELRLADNHFTETLQLQNARLERQFTLDKTRFDGDLLLTGAQIDGDLSMQGVRVSGDTYLMDVQIDGNLFAQNESFYGRDFLAYRMKLTKDAFLGDDSVFEGEFNISSSSVGGSIDASNGTSFDRDFDAIGIKVGGDFLLNLKSVFNGEVDIRGGEVEGNLYLSDESSFKKDVQLSRMKFGGGMFADSNSTFEASFSAGSIYVGDDVALGSGSVFRGEVELHDAKIEGQLRAQGGAIFEKEFQAYSIYIGDSLFLQANSVFRGDVNFTNATVSGSVHADGSKFEGSLSFGNLNLDNDMRLGQGSVFNGVLTLNGAKIGGLLNLGGGYFNQAVYLMSTKIERELLLSNSQGRPNWGKDAKLILRNTTAGAFQTDMQAWYGGRDGRRIAVDLRGFRYDQIGGYDTELTSDPDTMVPSAADAGKLVTNMADASASELIAWIEGRDEDGKRNPAHDAIFTPQPYSALADALDKAGADQTASAIRFARYEHRRNADNTSAWDKFWLFGSKIFIGYGVYPFRILGWFAFLVGAGIVVAHFSKCESLRGFFPKLWFSAENAFPLIETRDRFKGLDHCNSTVETLFHLQKLFGFILATVLVGALTLLGG